MDWNEHVPFIETKCTYKVPFQRLLGSLFVNFQEIKILLPPRRRINIIFRIEDRLAGEIARWKPIVVELGFSRPRVKSSFHSIFLGSLVPTRPRRLNDGPRLAAVSKLWRNGRPPRPREDAIKSAASRCPPRLARASFTSSIVARLRNRVFRIKRSVASSLDTRDRASISFVRSFVRVSLVRLLRTVDGSTARGGLIMEA